MSDKFSPKESKDIFNTFSEAIDQSRHKSLICAGLELFSDYMKGDQPDFKKLENPIKESTRILAEDVDKELRECKSTDSHIKSTHRCIAKSFKKQILESIGESLPKDEEEELKKDTKEMLTFLLQALDLKLDK